MATQMLSNDSQRPRTNLVWLIIANLCKNFNQLLVAYVHTLSYYLSLA